MSEFGENGSGANPASEMAESAAHETASAASSMATGEASSIAAGGTQAAMAAGDAAAGAVGGEAGEAMSRGTQAIGAASSATSSAMGMASAVQQGGAAGAIGTVGSAAGLTSAASNGLGAVGVSSDALRTAGQIASVSSQAAGAAGQVATLARGDGGGGGAGSAAQAATAALGGLGGPEGSGVTLSFETDGTVSTVWVASHASIHEALSTPYAAHVSLTTHDVDADPAELLGATCTVRIARGDLERVVHGIVDEVTTGAEPSSTSHTQSCTVRMVPALALLAHTRNSRIFQGSTVVEILEEVLPAALGPYDRDATVDAVATYPPYEYKTQYDESDLAFVQRLCAEEGLFYFFDHAGAQEKLLVVDDPSKYPALETTGPRLPFVRAEGVGGHEAVTHFARTDRMRPTTLVLRQYDWTNPGTFVEGTEPAPSSGGGQAPPTPPGASIGAAREVYEHDSRPVTFHGYDEGAKKYASTDVAEQAKLRRHQHVQGALLFAGDSTAVNLAAGTAFTLSGHPNPDFDGSYAVVSVTHTVHVGEAAQGHGGVAALEATYSNHFTCTLATEPYRPTRPVEKPRVRGMLTALVVGKPDEEIHTDPHGRIRVQFHWDRQGGNDEFSSCFLRVVQPWAGNGWGFVFIPRVGMEAVVSFLDGDPDRPIVTGTVYNGANPISQDNELPEHLTRSGIKTNSTDGHEGSNEIRFEDKGGEEEFYIHAQKDLKEVVENDHTTTVKQSQTNSVGGDRSVSVTGNQTVSVKKDETYTVTQNRTTKVDGGNDHLTVATEWKLTVGASTITVTDGKIVLTTGGATLTLDHSIVDLKSHDGGQVYLTANALMQSSDGSKVKLDANADLKSSGNGQVYLTGDALMQSSGGSAVKLDSNATVSGVAKAAVGAPQVEIVGDAMAKVATGGSVVQTSPAGVTASGSTVTVSGSGMVTVSGGVVAIN